jgi:hypothetical protein
MDEVSRLNACRNLSMNCGITNRWSLPVAVWSNTQICWPLIAGIAGAQRAEGVDVRLLCLFYIAYVAASAASWSLVQRISTRYLCVCRCMWSRNLKLGLSRPELAWLTIKKVTILWPDFDNQNALLYGKRLLGTKYLPVHLHSVYLQNLPLSFIVVEWKSVQQEGQDGLTELTKLICAFLQLSSRTHQSSHSLYQ